MNLVFNKKYLSLALVCCLISYAIIGGCRKSTPTTEQPNEPVPQAQEAPKAEQTPAQEQQPQQTPEATGAEKISKSVKQIIDSRSTWNPILEDFYGKQMPDISFTDITGKAHKLSDYKGKNVMVVFWATWCRPCMEEVPHLNALRDIIPEDKLAIIAISNEDEQTVKKTAQERKMKYTVAAVKESLPEPFNKVNGIPTAFYIKPDGTLKLTTEGGTYLGEMKSIVVAE